MNFIRFLNFFFALSAMIFSHQLSAQAPPACRNADSLALVALYNATGGATWTTPWVLTNPITTWTGVQLNASGCVFVVNLSGRNLNGTIPPQLGNIADLEWLDLSNNTLTGTIPATVNALSKLKRANFNKNQLSGAIPAFPPSSKTLIFSENSYTGAIPNVFGGLSALDTLILSKNQFDGLAPSFAGIPVKHLDLSDNILTNLPALTNSPTPLLRAYVQNNRLHFNAIEANLPLGIPLFVYNPQDSVGTAKTRIACEGNVFRDTIHVGGAYNRYTWYKGATPVFGGGAGDSILVINPVTATSGGLYYCRVTNINATEPSSPNTNLTLYGRALNLVVKKKPTNNNIITNDTIICVGAPLPTLIGSTPVPGDVTFTYLWQRSPDSLNWTDAGNLKNLNVTGITTTHWYRRLLVTSCGNDTSEVVKVSFVVPFGPNTVFPNAHTVCYPDSSGILTGSLTTATGTTSFSFKWIISTNDGATWTTTPYTDVNFPRIPVPDTIWVRRIVLGGCLPDTSNISKIFPILPVVADSIFRTQMVCFNSLADTLKSKQPTGGTGVYRYYWEKSSDGITWQHADSTGATYLPPPVTDSTYYRLIVRSGCSSDTSNRILLYVAPNLNSFKEISVSRKLVCYGTPFPQLTGLAPTWSNGFSYLWQSSLDSVAWNNQDTTRNYQPDSTFSELQGSVWFRRIIRDTCNTFTSNVIKITVADTIRNNVISPNIQTICFGDTLWKVIGSLPQGGLGTDTTRRYVWQFAQDSVWGNKNGDKDLLAFPLNGDTVKIRRLVVDSCYSDTSNIVRVVIQYPYGRNEIFASDTVICLGEKVSITGTPPSNTRRKYVWQWQYSPDSIIWTDHDTSAVNFEADTILFNTTYFRRIVLGGCKTDTSNVLKVVVNPNVENNFIASSHRICEGQEARVLVGTMPTGGTSESTLRLIWQQSRDSLDWVTVLESDSILNYAPGFLTDTTYFRRLAQLDRCSPVSSNVVRIDVVKKIRNNRIFDDQKICLGDTVARILATQPTGGDSTKFYQWQFLLQGDSVWKNLSSLQVIQPGKITKSTKYRRIVWSQPCESFRDTSNVITMTVIEPFTGLNKITGEQTICKLDRPDTLKGSVIVDSLGVIGNFKYQWQIFKVTDSLWRDINGAVRDFYIPNALDTTAFFRRLVINDCFRDSSNRVMIRVLPLPRVYAGKDTVTEIGFPIQLEAFGTAVSYVWEPAQFLDNDSIFNPTATIFRSTRFKVTGTDRNGCKNTDEVFVRVIDDPKVRPVDAISPNGDGLNDTFFIFGIERYPENSLVICDRRGEEIYVKENYQNEFDGTYNGNPLPNGVYFYILRIKHSTKITKGSFMILR